MALPTPLQGATILPTDRDMLFPLETAHLKLHAWISWCAQALDALHAAYALSVGTGLS